jgi:hypothetical protein
MLRKKNKLKCLSLSVLANVYNDGKYQLSNLCEVPYKGHTRLLGLQVNISQGSTYLLGTDTTANLFEQGTLKEGEG